MKTYILFLLVAMLTAPRNLSAQYTPTLEFTSVGGPSGSGPSIASQTVTLRNNTNNPSGNTFVAFAAPTTTVTFSLSNQQYPLSTTYSSTGASVVFGGGNNLGQKAINGLNYYYVMDDYSAPADNDFTSAGTITAGTGIDVTANYSLQVFTSVMGLNPAGASTTGSYYMADLTITFNTLVTNPVIHLVGLGGTGSNGLGFSNELYLATPSLTLTRLSGSKEFAVSGTQILNTATPIGGTTGSGGASGSVLVTGTNISSMTFHVYMRGDGGATTWPTGNTSGDGFMIGVSMLTVNSVLPLSITKFTATNANSNAQLQWDAADGGNSSFFDVESSRDGTTWQDIGMVMATGDDNTTYTYTDPHTATGNNFYRIKEVDAAGNAVYSPVETVYISGQSPTANVFPNPVRNRLFIADNGSAIQSVIVTGADGKEMARYNSLAAGNSIDMSTMPGGIYFVTIGYASGTKQTTPIVKY